MRGVTITAVTNIFIGLSLSLSIVSVSCEDEYKGTLRLVNVIFRHGERTPADTYPTDPHVNFDFHPYGWGQLTNNGKMQQFQQGKFLRQRYQEFLGKLFSNDMVKVTSTDVDRTIMSAQLTLAGLFPPEGTDKWNSELQWQPIPVHYQPLSQDSLLLVRIPCPRYHEELEQVKRSEEVAHYLDSLAGMYAALSNHTKSTISDPDEVQSLYNTLLGEKLFNLPIPDWTREFFPDKMEAVTAYSFVLNAYNDELKKLKGGPLLKKILKDSEAKINESLKKRKIFMYAGHDSTVSNLMMALKVWDQQIPVYNIMSIIELHQIDDVYGIKVFLRNSTDHEPYLLTIPGCESFCPYTKVIELTKNVIPDNLETECKSIDPNYRPPNPSGP